MCFDACKQFSSSKTDIYLKNFRWFSFFSVKLSQSVFGVKSWKQQKWSAPGRQKCLQTAIFFKRYLSTFYTLKHPRVLSVFPIWFTHQMVGISYAIRDFCDESKNFLPNWQYRGRAAKKTIIDKQWRRHSTEKNDFILYSEGEVRRRKQLLSDRTVKGTQRKKSWWTNSGEDAQRKKTKFHII
jgi:hypothetical protein